jgi:hypothetical protein
MCALFLRYGRPAQRKRFPLFSAEKSIGSRNKGRVIKENSSGDGRYLYRRAAMPQSADINAADIAASADRTHR